MAWDGWTSSKNGGRKAPSADVLAKALDQKLFINPYLDQHSDPSSDHQEYLMLPLNEDLVAKTHEALAWVENNFIVENKQPEVLEAMEAKVAQHMGVAAVLLSLFLSYEYM